MKVVGWIVAGGIMLAAGLVISVKDIMVGVCARMGSGLRTALRALVLSACAMRDRLARSWDRLRQRRSRFMENVQRLLTRWYIHYRVEVNEQAKCPACGKRLKHKIVWEPAYNALMHTCGFCNARWGEKPLVKVEVWRVQEVVTEPAEDKQPKGQGLMHVVRN